MTKQQENIDSKNGESEEIDAKVSMKEEGQTGDAFDSAMTSPKQVMITDVELKNMQKELMDYKDKYLRLLADNENTRKRMQKERQEMTKYALEGIIVDFLHPLDNFENALKFAQGMSDDVKHWALGFQMILSQFKDILAENGVQPIDSVGEQFDPHNHEAMEMIETPEQLPGTILEEYVRGYKMGERTIRPARVKVAKTVSPTSEEDPENSEEDQKSLK